MTSSRRSTRESLSTRPMIITIAAVVAVGGFVLPLIGWFAGITMMWLSPVWSSATKWCVTLVPFAVGAACWRLGMSGAIDPRFAFAIAAVAAIAPGLWLLRGLLR